MKFLPSFLLRRQTTAATPSKFDRLSKIQAQENSTRRRLLFTMGCFLAAFFVITLMARFSPLTSRPIPCSQSRAASLMPMK